MALALECRFEAFSQGRGPIAPRRVEEIEAISARHGIYLVPFYNAAGPVEGCQGTFAGPRSSPQSAGGNHSFAGQPA